MENRLIDSLRRADRFWLLDGAMGTQLQKKLVAAGRSILGLIPELCCITEPEYSACHCPAAEILVL